MQKRFKDQGFVAISVSLDDANEEGAQDNVRKFLRESRAAFRNFILDEKPAFWEEKLKIDGPPCAFVFDRDGKIAKKYEGFFEYTNVEPLVAELLKKKN